MLEPIDLLKVEKNAEEKLQNLASTQATKRKSDLLACANDTATDAAVAGLDMKETRFAQVSLDALNDLQSYVKCKRCGGDVSVRTDTGAYLPLTPGSTFCECSGLLLHDAHGRSPLRRRWAEAQKDGGVGNTTTATDDIIRHLQSEPQFDKWVASLASGATAPVPADPTSSSPTIQQWSPPPDTTPGTASTDRPATPVVDETDCTFVDLDFDVLI
ncbi:hypothetical protein HPB52_017235 [Rhipicephalus sanguineus]|uniref:Uncharacterized protein n=1 Tax=Rhipicephalus sanguineus TaxID=34632 RepID=A0A9D4PY56_RHISA|nr:hypothetical protein HPB52_017235 [Rhipicephalus sanguineus]